MPDFGIMRGFNDKLFGDKLYAGQLPTQLGLIGSETSSPFISATGGVITFDGNFKIHTFTSSANFDVSIAPVGQTIELLAVAGGGGGGSFAGGGGGAGGLIYEASRSVTVQNYPIVIGSAGAGAPSRSVKGTNGNNTTFDGLTSIGGGAAGSELSNPNIGGSGGGGSRFIQTGANGTFAQGFQGGNSLNTDGGGGGGGSSEIGGNSGGGKGGDGGDGLAFSISGTLQNYAGGGGAAGALIGLGGNGGGGNGNNSANTINPINGVANTGGGGGGSWINVGANGGSGIVIIRYRFQ